MMKKRKKRGKSRTKPASSSKEKSLTGKLQLHGDGYGFVLPDDRKEKDVFVPAHAIRGAMNGDKVEVSVKPRPGGKKQEGKILKILERGQRQVVGRFEITSNGFFVLCEDRRNLFRVKIDAEKTLKALSGQTVVVRITRYAEKDHPMAGEVVKLLGDRKEPETETQIVIAEHHLTEEFPTDVLEMAGQYQEKVSDEEWGRRKDLRSLPIVTIDGETAKDFDDGIYVEKIPAGYRLYVAIADVSHFVIPHTPLDKEAYRRSTSVYFPNYCIPMLPEVLSNGLCSLVPHRERLSFVAEMDFDLQGRKIRSDFYKGVILNASRLTYTKVQKMMVEGDEALRKEYSFLLKHLETAFELYGVLRGQRMKRGSIDFDLPEPQIVLDVEEGIATSIVKAARTQAHMLIEEFMVAANEAVAESMADRDLPMIYRVHEAPDPEKIGDFRILAHNLGHSMPSAEKMAPKDLARIVQEVRGKPYERLINTLLLRSLKQAVYSPENLGHFGLASAKYTHFTSPIRRYPDLIVHRLLHESLHSNVKTKGKKDRDRQLERLGEMAAHCSKLERNAMEAEWEIRDLHVALFMKDKVGEEFDGIISSVTKFGFFVELLTYFVEGLVPLNTLTAEDSYEFLEKRHELQGRRTKKRFRIGDPVRIKVVRVDIEQRKLDFFLVSSLPGNS